VFSFSFIGQVLGRADRGRKYEIDRLIDEASKERTLLRPILKSLEFVKAAKKLEWNRALAKT
jgi:hypothetical protein